MGVVVPSAPMMMPFAAPVMSSPVAAAPFAAAAMPAAPVYASPVAFAPMASAPVAVAPAAMPVTVTAAPVQQYAMASAPVAAAPAAMPVTVTAAPVQQYAVVPQASVQLALPQPRCDDSTAHRPLTKSEEDLALSLARALFASSGKTKASPVAAAPAAPGKTLEERVTDLEQRVDRVEQRVDRVVKICDDMSAKIKVHDEAIKRLSE